MKEWTFIRLKKGSGVGKRHILSRRKQKNQRHRTKHIASFRHGEKSGVLEIQGDPTSPS